MRAGEEGVIGKLVTRELNKFLHQPGLTKFYSIDYTGSTKPFVSLTSK